MRRWSLEIWPHHGLVGFDPRQKDSRRASFTKQGFSANAGKGAGKRSVALGERRGHFLSD